MHRSLLSSSLLSSYRRLPARSLVVSALHHWLPMGQLMLPSPSHASHCTPLPGDNTMTVLLLVPRLLE